MAVALALFSAACVSAAALQPDIRTDRIVFVGGRVLPYHLKATRSGTRPGETVVVEERPILISGWKRLLLVKTSRLYEGDAKEISVYDYAGNLLAPSRTIVGEIVILEGKRRLFLAQRSAHYLVNESLILDADGGVVRTVLQPENVVAFGNSEDQELVWIVSNAIRDGKPIGRVDVFTINGDRVDVIEFRTAGRVNVNYGGRNYNISVGEPQIPG
jgi:hypothetical protein